jgi:putative spermidine/putrescine transport system permease protein
VRIYAVLPGDANQRDRMMRPTVCNQFAGLSRWPLGAALSFVLMTATQLLTVTSHWVAHRRCRR